jgi:tRNA(His) 5'-end guanylyltransferase
MKAYESQYAGQVLLPRIPVLCRLDGKAFHGFCKGLRKPYDERLSELMVQTTQFLVEQTNANCGYTQSDEISLVWQTSDFNSEIFFGGRVLKMTSVLTSLTTWYFNTWLHTHIPEKGGTAALFDARVWNVPLETEAANYFVWREKDATRNSISMAAQSVCSHNQLHKKNSDEMQEMLFQRGINWNDYPDFFKRGTYVQKRTVVRLFTESEIDKLPPKHEAHTNPNLAIQRQQVMRLPMMPITRITNRTDVLLRGADPMVHMEVDLLKDES